MINRSAIAELPPQVPAFLHSAAALDEVEYLAPEPDRWYGGLEPELNNAQSPDHYLNMEHLSGLSPLPPRRMDYIQMLYASAIQHPKEASELTPGEAGMLPWSMLEVYERLEIAFRQYRLAQAENRDPRPMEQAAIFYAGWLGHYCGDASQPLHTTAYYDGWTNPDNPNNYSTVKGLHSLFETAFVNSSGIGEKEIRQHMSAPQQLNVSFSNVLGYVTATHTQLNRLYQLEKNGGYMANGTPESRAFVLSRLSSGASELRDLIVAAWLASERPEPAHKN